MLATMLVVGVMAPAFREAMETAMALEDNSSYYDYDDYEEEEAEPMGPAEIEAATERFHREAEEIAALVREFEATNGVQVEDLDMVLEVRQARDPDAAELLDPFDGLSYGFDRVEDGFIVWSSGPDREPRTEDDLGAEFAATGD